MDTSRPSCDIGGMNKVGWLLLALSLCACGDKKKVSEDDAPAESSKDKKKQKKKGSSVASSSASAKAAPSASAAPTASASAAPPTLAAMFDGEPDASIPFPTSTTLGRVSIGLPEGWARNNGWSSVDSFEPASRKAGVVLITLDLSEAYLDQNIATWVKVPFATNEVQWGPTEPGKVGRAHLDARIAHGTGKFGSDDAEFWQVATAFDGKKYGAVFIAGLKAGASEQERAQMIAVVKSVTSK